MGGRYIITGSQIGLLTHLIKQPDGMADAIKELDAIFKNQFINVSTKPLQTDLNSIRCLIQKDKLKKNLQTLKYKIKRIENLIYSVNHDFKGLSYSEFNENEIKELSELALDLKVILENE